MMNKIKKSKFSMENMPAIPSFQFPEVEKPLEESSKDITSNIPEVPICDLHDAQIRDALRHPKLFFSTSASLEEALVLLIAMRVNFPNKRYDIPSFRSKWIEKELSWLPSYSTLHETLSQGGLQNYDLHCYLLSRMIRDFAPELYAERESHE
jgi:hypothetical protein